MSLSVVHAYFLASILPLQLCPASPQTPGKTSTEKFRGGHKTWCKKVLGKELGDLGLLQMPPTSCVILGKMLSPLGQVPHLQTQHVRLSHQDSLNL